LISLNRADNGYGGAICSSSAALVMTDCVANQNTALLGGVLALDGSESALTRNRFSNNVAGNEGGAVYFQSSTTFSATALSLLGNTAYVDTANDFGDGSAGAKPTCESECASGEFGNCMIVHGFENCAINCACTLCTTGHFNNQADSWRRRRACRAPRVCRHWVTKARLVVLLAWQDPMRYSRPWTHMGV